MAYPIFLSLGSNLGNRAAYLHTATQALNNSVASLHQCSAIYETKPWGISEQPLFYNQVLKISSHLQPQELLKKILEIEQSMGRVRQKIWGERIIDIDILYYEQAIVAEEDLQVPHPQIPQRRFVLVPLVEIAPDFIHPQWGITQTQLLAQCPDTLEVIKITPQ